MWGHKEVLHSPSCTASIHAGADELGSETSDWGQGYEVINLGTWRTLAGDFLETYMLSITKLPRYLRPEYINPYFTMRKCLTAFFSFSTSR